MRSLGGALAAALVCACTSHHSGSAQFSEGPIRPSDAVANTFVTSGAPNQLSGYVGFFDRGASCGERPRCAFTGGSIGLLHLVDGGAQPLVAGQYQVVPSMPSGDAGTGELLLATLTAETVTASSSGNNGSPGQGLQSTEPFPDSELGCEPYYSSVGDGGTVTIAIDGGTLEGTIDANVEVPQYASPQFPSYRGRWTGTFSAPVCQ